MLFFGGWELSKFSLATHRPWADRRRCRNHRASAESLLATRHASSSSPT